jgi:uncharacterized protein YciI
MLYTIIAEDKENSLQERLEKRPEHLVRINELVDKGRLVIAGGHPAVDAEDPGPAGFTGSLIVAEFNNLDEAKNWAEADIFWREGVWSKLQVKPLRKALP